MWSGRKTLMTHSGYEYCWLTLAERRLTLALAARPTSGASERMSAAWPAPAPKPLASAPATRLLPLPETADSLEHMLVPLAVADATAIVSARFADADADADAHEPFAATEPEREVSVL